MVVYLFIKLI